MKGNLIEIYYTLELLAQFTFNEVIKQSINESKEYDDILESLMIRTLVNEDDTQVYSSIRRVVEQIKWNLNKENRHSGASSIGSLGALSLNSTDQHIMISYNSSSRDLCLKIKRELELMEYKVWIDVNTISGSSLEAMSNAVENSFCVLCAFLLEPLVMIILFCKSKINSNEFFLELKITDKVMILSRYRYGVTVTHRRPPLPNGIDRY